MAPVEGIEGRTELLPYSDRSFTSSCFPPSKTVEIIEELLPWRSPDPDEEEKVRVGYGELEVRRRVKEAGGWWNRVDRVWMLPRYRAVQYGLEGRIVEG